MASGTRTVLMKEIETQGFTRLTEPVDLHRFLSRAIDSMAKVDIRFPKENIQFQSKILESSHVEKGFRFEAPAEGSLPEEDQLKSPSEGVMVIVFLRGQVLLCIHSKNAEWKDGEFFVAPPWSVFKLQRRKEPRYEIPAAYELFVTMDSLEGGRKRVQKRVLDISEHGMGIQVASSREAAYFKKGLFLRQMEMVLENRQIFFDAKVSNVLPLKHPRLSGMKVGLEIIRMASADASFVASYVARNLVQVYA